jgi:hypothetical protein
VITAMGIESDQAVFDYLSRVGDLAQATSLTAAERARLVSDLRRTIDTRRGGTPGGPVGPVGPVRGEATAVKKILSGIGSPDEVVRRAVHNGVPGTAEPRPGSGGPSVPTQSGPPPGRRDRTGGDRTGGGDARGGGGGGGGTEGWWRGGPWGGSGPGRDTGGGATGVDVGGGWTGTGAGGLPGFGSGGAAEAAAASTAGLPGWRASLEPDFLDPDLGGPGGSGERGPVPGQRQPPGEAEDEAPAPPGGKGAKNAARKAARKPRRSLLRRLVSGPPPRMVPAEPAMVAVPRSRVPLVESLAALVLLASAVLGLWYVAVLGWLLAYTGRRIGRSAAHVAGLWLPLLVACACGFWLYGQVHGQPAGHPLPDVRFKADVRSAVGVWLRAAAGCSAAFLAWRIARRR